jgi:hypothetical protein
MISVFPILKDSGWQFLRPKTIHSKELVPFSINEQKNGLILRK